MPFLLFLSLAGVFAALRIKSEKSRPVVLLLLSAIPLTGILLATVVVSHRYTADFCPLFVGLAAFGLVALESRLSESKSRFLLFTREYLFLCVLLFVSIFTTANIALGYQGKGVWGVPESATARFEKLQTLFP